MLSSRIDANANDTQIDYDRKFGFLMKKGHFYGCSKNIDLQKNNDLRPKNKDPLMILIQEVTLYSFTDEKQVKV